MVLVENKRLKALMLRLVLLKTGNAPIPTMKIRKIEYQTGFLNSTRWKIRCSFNPKAQAVNKVHRQLGPEQYFPEFFKSLAQVWKLDENQSISFKI